jgi:protein ImuA
MSQSPAPVDLLHHPRIWRGQELAASEEPTVPTGHAALDAVLPGGGWPQGALVELLSLHPERHAWQLVLPALSEVTRTQPGPVILVGAPFVPFCPSLESQGLAVQRLLWITATRPQARLWSAEQALRCADVPAVMAWLPQCRGTDLRRMQLAAQQHNKLLFVFRSEASASESSPARLRLQIEGTDTLKIRVLKRRGPPLMQPVALPAHPPALAALLASRKGRAVALPIPQDRSHVLDRTAAYA